MTICRKELSGREDDIDCPIMIARWCRSKFWFVFVALFVLWFTLLHVIDWSSPPIPATSISDLNHATNSNPLASSLDSDSDISSVKPDIDQDLVGNISRVFSEKIDGAESVHENESGESVVNDDKIDGIKEEGKNVAVEIDWVEDVQQLNALQKELEPLVGGNEEEEEDHKKVEETIKKEDPKVAIKRPCNGRYVYIHELPTRYNEDLLKQCRSLNKWADMCQSMVNAGLGPRLGNPQRVFSTTGWYSTNQFMLEVIFHNRMKQYECLTNDSSLASAIFVPYYPGLDVARYLWGFNMSMRDSASLDLAKWLREKPEWKGMYGRDHFLVAGRITWDFRRGIDEEDAWGNKFMLLPEFKNTTVLTIESSPWNSNDFGIPYPTYFHPANDNEVFRWQNKMRKQRRKSLFCFAGAPRLHLEESIRKEVMDQCIASRRKCRLLECTNERNKCLKPVYLMKLFQNSVFCLQPPGDSFTRRSTFDSILAGCIPVFFSPGSAYVQYLWHLPRDFSKYSVLIPEDDVKENKVSIKRVLSEIPRSKVKEMREEVIKLIPKVIYADPRSRLETLNDAFDLTVDGVLERVENLRKEIREGKNSSIENDEENSWKYYLFGTTEKHEWDHFFRRTNRGRY